MHALDLRTVSRPRAPRLPPHDPALRPAALATWRGRMVNEYASSTVFEALALQLAQGGFDEGLVAECRGFADEERRHGVLCGAVVEALGGEARAELPTPPAFPRHDDVSRRVAALRNVLSVCCMSETVAVALIGAERIEMEVAGKGPLWDLLGRILADEVGHARFGWRLLERVADGLTEDERAGLTVYLPVALAHLEAHELSHLPDHGGWAGGERLGLCSGRDARTLFFATVREVIVPGLERLLGADRPPVRELPPYAAEVSR